MIQKSLFALCIVFLTACSSTPSTSPPPTQGTVQSASATATRILVPTATQTPPAITPQPTTDPNFFRDEFIGAFRSDWNWVREDALNWSLVVIPGSLQINVNSGYVQAHSNSNLLLRPAPQGNFQVETQMAFRPRNNFQFAGLIIYQDDSNFIQGGRSYCNAVGCVGDGLYMDYYEKGVLVRPNFGHAYTDTARISVRLSRSDDKYTFEASINGYVWFNIGTYTSNLKPLQVGLVAGQKLEGNILPAAFEYFQVRSLP